MGKHQSRRDMLSGDSFFLFFFINAGDFTNENPERINGKCNEVRFLSHEGDIR